ncbi:MAG: hypothetical protein PHS41_12740 [Victivallaceae bacterium]|nr:hypothetical protein [Victivallaceae bacterium]
MFLGMLTEENKKLFLDLAYFAANTDGNFAQEEKEMIESYAGECELPDFLPSKRTFEECLELLRLSPANVRKTIFLELIGIWAADNKWEDSEIEMMEKIGKTIGLPNSRINRFKGWNRELRDLVADGYKMISEE